MILLVGDLHFKNLLNYSYLFDDNREKEREEILNKIISLVKEYKIKDVVLLGDQLNSKNSISSVLTKFVSFLRDISNNGATIHIIAGNHEKGFNTSALDFLKEIEDSNNWHIYLKPTLTTIQNKKVLMFPHMFARELDAESSDEWSKKLNEIIEQHGEVDFLFHHHAFQGVGIPDGVEGFFDVDTVVKHAKLTVGGHVHTKYILNNNILGAGSIFTLRVNEKEKSVFMLDPEKEPLVNNLLEVKLPVTPIYKFTDDDYAELNNIDQNSIVKVVINDKENLADVKKLLLNFKHAELVELPMESSLHNDDDIDVFLLNNIDDAIKYWSKENNVSEKRLNNVLKIFHELTK